MSKKNGRNTIPDAAAKLQEAQEASLKMKKTLAYDAPITRREDCLLYLKRFQEACYSVTISLDKAKKGWRKNLDPQQAELINFMLEQRGTETHNAGAVGLRKETKWYPAIRFKEVEITSPPALFITSGIPNTNAIGLPDYYFDTRTGRKEIIPTCDEYLAVLARQI